MHPKALSDLSPYRTPWIMSTIDFCKLAEFWADDAGDCVLGASILLTPRSCGIPRSS